MTRWTDFAPFWAQTTRLACRDLAGDWHIEYVDIPSARGLYMGHLPKRFTEGSSPLPTSVELHGSAGDFYSRELHTLDPYSLWATFSERFPNGVYVATIKPGDVQRVVSVQDEDSEVQPIGTSVAHTQSQPVPRSERNRIREAGLEPESVRTPGWPFTHRFLELAPFCFALASITFVVGRMQSR